MDRRTFLTRSGLSIGGLMFAGCATSARFAANDRIELAAIGCGRMGRGNIRNLLRVADEHGAILTAVCDVDRRRLDAARALVEGHYAEAGVRHEVRAFERHEDLLRNAGIDAVMIATPDHSHAAVAVAAARAGKDIYLEKPLTYSIREGQDLVGAVRGNHCILQGGTQQRSSIYFRKVCELVRNGKVGQLERIEVRVPSDSGYGDPAPMPVPAGLDYDRWLGSAPCRPYAEDRVHPQVDFSRPGWMQVSDYCHGMITNWGSHMFDIAHWGGGMELSGPVSVEAEAAFEVRGLFDVHRRFTATNRYANGVVLDFRTLADDSSEKPGVRFIGSDGWLWCERGSFDAHDRTLLRWEPGPDDSVLPRSTDHHRDFLEAVRARKDPICPVEVAHRSNSACILKLIAAKLGRPLHWEPEAERFVNDTAAARYIDEMRQS